MPLCGNEWEPDLCGKRAHPCPECSNRAFVPLTVQIVKAHLMGQDSYGRDAAGIYPTLEDDRAWLLAAGFDEGTVSLLESWGITAETREDLWQRWAVIDKTVVWYGSIDYLSCSAKDANALRFESADAAGEVLELQASAGLPEQLSMEDVKE